MYFVGVGGYEAEDEFPYLADAEKAAKMKSLEKIDCAISVWDACDDVVAVALNGDIFDRRSM